MRVEQHERIVTPEMAEYEVFYTPPEPIRDFLDSLPALPASTTVLDPCAGAGAIPVELILRGIPAHQITCCEIRESQRDTLQALGCPTVIGNFLSEGPTLGTFDLIMSNPPFTKIREFVEVAHPLLNPGGLLVFLGRLGFTASNGRASFHRAYPSDMYPIPYRPSFIGFQEDRWDYAWYVWHNPLREGRIIRSINGRPKRKKKAQVIEWD